MKTPDALTGVGGFLRFGAVKCGSIEKTAAREVL